MRDEGIRYEIKGGKFAVAVVGMYMYVYPCIWGPRKAVFECVYPAMGNKPRFTSSTIVKQVRKSFFSVLFVHNNHHHHHSCG